MAASDIWYVDSSVILRALVDGSDAATTWFEATNASGAWLVASRLLEIEVRRAVRNLGLAGRQLPPSNRVDEYLQAFDFRQIDDVVATQAITIDQPLRSGDAIHLATALLWGAAAVQIATHDAQMAAAARALGFSVHDPVIDDPRRSPVA